MSRNTGNMLSKQHPKPDWLRKTLPRGGEYEKIRRLVRENQLCTVCQEAKCPNLWECFSKGTATFMIMGPVCTRDCRFCAVNRGTTEPPDPNEPSRIAETVCTMKLSYAVITSVTRDDLKDGGADMFSKTIREIRKKSPGTKVEVLIPDFQGDCKALEEVLEARPDVLNHNIETVERLYPVARPSANYQRSLEILARAKLLYPQIPTKSGIMLGLGETEEEVYETLIDLRKVGCDILTIGQYLQPTLEHLSVSRYITPEDFCTWRLRALDAGFSGVKSGPFVRSSYRAMDLYKMTLK